MPDADHLPFDQRLTQVHQDKGKALRRLARRQLNAAGLPASRVDAEDILQEALLTVLENARDKQIDDLYPYLCAVVRNKVRDTADKARRKPADPIDTTDRTAETYKPLHVSDVEEDTEGRLDLEDVLKGMSPQQRRLILLSKAVGYTHAELAIMTGLNKGTVATHIRRATAVLASLILIGCIALSLWYRKLISGFQWVEVGSDDEVALLQAAVNFLLLAPVTLIILVSAVGVGWVVLRQRVESRKPGAARGPRFLLADLDVLHSSQFERAVRDMMRRDGCADAAVGGGFGDIGVDVKATDPFGRRWVIQCKHRRAGLAGAPVGAPDLQALSGTGRSVHGGDVVVLVTNGRISKPALEFAGSQQLLVVDRAVLGEWAGGSGPLWDLLQAGSPSAGRR
ncbi:sigma-70 family RNA polymerase sigma factor [Streptomyces sp. NPDC001927]